MGIPKFYRWLSERYPLINQPIASTHVPVVDNLYLDMNGIIHNCTHGNDPNVKLTEEEMILKVFAYIERLFQIVQPQKLLFAAIDGCAPRAKMNQQRSRRFKSAKEAAAAAAKRELEQPEEGPPREAFDSNCITPGTPFMGRLAAHLCFFFRKKIAEDPAWQKPRIIFSGHDVPGEGEHKIMEHIRWAKRSPDYEPNQRHCLYGLDADLIMLALVSHEPHFCLLREAVSFGGGGRGQPSREVLANPKKEHFVLFQIGLLREYLELEFQAHVHGFPFDIERVVDDFVFFCMLIGNDFLPTLPTLDVNEGALDSIFGIYKRLLPHAGGYLTDSGRLNLGRLEMLLAELAALELDTLEQRAADAEYFENKRQKRGPGNGQPAAKRAPPPQPLPEEDARIASLMSELGGTEDLTVLEALEDPSEAQPPPAAEPTMMSREARQLMLSGQGQAGLQLWKARYYRDKLEVDPEDPAALRQVVACYIEGLHWVLEYYYRGVASWGWCYPFHYSPMVSDLTGLQGLQPRFDYGTPFTPYQQLLAVLPSASHKLLPKPYQWLMTDPSSPIVDFYPLDFRLDGEGKRQEWEAVAVLGFVDEPRLRAAAASVPQQQLSPEERQRNEFGRILHFQHAPGSQETSYTASTLPARLPSVAVANSTCRAIEPPPPLPEGELGFCPVLAPGTVAGKGGPPGFPTLKTLELEAELKMAAVNVLGQSSKKASLILAVKGIQAEAAQASAAQLGLALVGQRVWIKWPYLQEAVVCAVSDAQCKVHGGGKPAKTHGGKEAEEWRHASTLLLQQFRSKQGIELGSVSLLLHVQPCEGLLRRVDGTVEKRFSHAQISYPLQVTLKHNPSPDPRLDPAHADHSAQGALPEGCRAIFLGTTHFGCLATVLAPLQGGRSGLRVSVEPAPAAATSAVFTAQRVLAGFQVAYRPSGQVAHKLGMSGRCLSMLTGSLFIRVDDKRIDVGLCVKNAQHGLCVPDYAKPHPEGTGWLYSPALQQALEAYKARFAWVIRAVDNNSEGRGDLDASDIFPDISTQERLAAVTAVRSWLKAQPFSRRLLVKTSAKVAPEAAIRTLQQALPPNLSRQQAPVELEGVAPALLLPPSSGLPNEVVGGNLTLADRVVFVGGSGPPPLGARGTIVGVHDDDFEVLFDAPFAGGTELQGRCHGTCGAVVAAEELLNLTKPPVPANGSQAAQAGAVRSAFAAPQPQAWGKAQMQMPEKAAPKQPPPGTWLSQRRGADTELNAAAASLANLQVPEGPAKPQARTPQRARKAVDPPEHGSQGSKGFAMGRGRGQPLQAPPGMPVPKGPTPPPPPPAASPPPGFLTPTRTASASISAGTPPSSAGAHPLLLALQARDNSAADLEHKVHHGMGAAREFLRMSQQDLAGMDSTPSAELPPPAPAQPNAVSSGGGLLAMLQGRSVPASPSRGEPRCSASTQTFKGPEQASRTLPPEAGQATAAAANRALPKQALPQTGDTGPAVPSSSAAAGSGSAESAFWDQLAGSSAPSMKARGPPPSPGGSGGAALLSMLRNTKPQPVPLSPAGPPGLPQKPGNLQQPAQGPSGAAANPGGRALLDMLRGGRPLNTSQPPPPPPPSVRLNGSQPPSNGLAQQGPVLQTGYFEAFGADKAAAAVLSRPINVVHPTGAPEADLPLPVSLITGAEHAAASSATSSEGFGGVEEPAARSASVGLDALWASLQQQHRQQSRNQARR